MKKVIIMALMLMPIVALSQNTVSERDYVEVRSNASREIEPNRISVSVTLSEEALKGKVSMAEMEQSFEKALKQAGVEIKKNVVLSSQFSDMAKRKKSYQFKTYLVTCSSTEELSNLFDAMKDNGIQNSRIVRVWNSNQAAIIDELKIEAIRKAKKTATLLAQELGQSIGWAIQITDMNYYQPNGEMILFRSQAPVRSGDVAVSNEVDEVAFKKIKLEQNITVKFMLKAY